jgi:hypothetical protein
MRASRRSRAPPHPAGRDVASVHRVLARPCHLGNRFEPSILGRFALVIFSEGRIGADREKILTCPATLMAGAGGQHDNVACLDTEGFSFWTTNLYFHRPASYAEHLECANDNAQNHKSHTSRPSHCDRTSLQARRGINFSRNTEPRYRSTGHLGWLGISPSYSFLSATYRHLKRFCWSLLRSTTWPKRCSGTP